MITHAFKFASEEEAKQALPQFLIEDTWITSFVDPGIFIVDAEENPVEGFHLNVALEVLDNSLEGLIGAWDEEGLVYGEHPETPQRVFAG